MRVVHSCFKSLNPGRRRRGFYLIGMLIALAIIFILMGRGYFFKEASPMKGVEQAMQAEAYIDRSQVSACLANRNTLKAELTTMSINNGGPLPGIHAMRAKLGPKICPDKGTLQLDDRGNVYCTLHEPAPEGVQVQDL